MRTVTITKQKGEEKEKKERPPLPRHPLTVSIPDRSIDESLHD